MGTRILSSDPLGGTVGRTVLPNGLRIITEAIPAMRSVSFGVWVAVGSRDESPVLAGASHFLEHLLFKGTRRRTALEISSQIEAVGGETNAFTTKEYTCFYARVLDTDLPPAGRTRRDRPWWTDAGAQQGHRTGPPRPGRGRTGARRRPAVRPRRAEQRARRWHVEPAVPADPRTARAGLLGVLLHLPVRRLRT